MTTLTELLNQKRDLEVAIAKAKAQEAREAIANVKRIVQEFNLSPTDIFGKAGSPGLNTNKSVERNKVQPKYRDPVTGNTWTGRGLRPQWLQGKNLSDFSIAHSSAN